MNLENLLNAQLPTFFALGTKLDEVQFGELAQNVGLNREISILFHRILHVTKATEQSVRADIARNVSLAGPQRSFRKPMEFLVGDVLQRVKKGKSRREIADNFVALGLTPLELYQVALPRRLRPVNTPAENFFDWLDILPDPGSGRR